MKAIITSFLFGLLANISIAQLPSPPQIKDKLAFVYEVVRHGARAPLAEEPPGYFKVPTEQLTAQGMRQRYLLGHRNRQRYIE